jgi:hypothetical protein
LSDCELINFESNISIKIMLSGQESKKGRLRKRYQPTVTHLWVSLLLPLLPDPDSPTQPVLGAVVDERHRSTPSTPEEKSVKSRT